MTFVLFLKEKITKEMNYILSNQDTVLSQITQLESSITQTEVCGISSYSLSKIINKLEL